MKLKKIAAGTGSEIEQGDPDLEISGAAGLDLAGSEEITFLANPKYTPQLKTTRAGAVFLKTDEEIARQDIAVLRCADPYLAYTRALRLFHPAPPLQPSIHPTAVIAGSARVADHIEIGAHVVIGEECEIAENVRIFPNATIYRGVRIGPGTVIHSNVSIREDTRIGRNCIIHNNAVIGSDGFGYAKSEDQSWLKIPQTGRVIIDDDVEIGAGTCIDRASVGETRIERGVKLDNLVQIGHSSTVEEDALICAQTGLAGTSHIGRRVLLAGQVGIAGHLKVGDDATVTAKSATSHDVEPGRIISGIPAFDNRDWLRSTAAYRRLGELAKTVRKLEKNFNQTRED